MKKEDEERFSESDLAPSADEKKMARREVIDRVAATLAVISAGGAVGGLIALGACAAPFVFRITPAPYSGEAMGSAFARFDQIAIGASVVMLGAEVARTALGAGARRSLGARLRRIATIVFAMCTVYIGLALTPQIMDLHRGGVRRNIGAEGAELERIHKRAELVGKVESVLGLVVIALHIFTLRRAEDDEELALTPLPPGPSRAR